MAYSGNGALCFTVGINVGQHQYLESNHSVISIGHRQPCFLAHCRLKAIVQLATVITARGLYLPHEQFKADWMGKGVKTSCQTEYKNPVKWLSALSVLLRGKGRGNRLNKQINNQINTRIKRLDRASTHFQHTIYQSLSLQRAFCNLSNTPTNIYKYILKTIYIYIVFNYRLYIYILYSL